MACITLEMLRRGDKVVDGDVLRIYASNTQPSNPPSLNSGNQLLCHEDNIPTEVRRHISEYLSSCAEPSLAASAILTHINDSPYVSQRNKLLSRTLIPGSPSDFTQTSSGLLDLPPEILGLMSDYLKPADMICLGLACKQLFVAIDYHLVDLKNLEFAGGELGRVFGEHQLFEPLAVERFAVKHHLDSDRISQLAAQEQEHSPSLTCSSCAQVHPRTYFSPTQISLSATLRKCLASTAQTRLCSHWTESHDSLLARSQRSAIEPLYRDIHRIQTCQHTDHQARHLPGSWSAPSLLDLGGTYSIERTLTLCHAPSRDSITQPHVTMLLHSNLFKGMQICSHVQASDSRVATSFKRNSNLLKDWLPEESVEAAMPVCVPEFEAASCDSCGTVWQFNILETSSTQDGRPTFAVQLIVDRQIRVTRHPWDHEYLRSIDGGNDLMRLMRQD